MHAGHLATTTASADRSLLMQTSQRCQADRMSIPQAALISPVMTSILSWSDLMFVVGRAEVMGGGGGGLEAKAFKCESRLWSRAAWVDDLLAAFEAARLRPAAPRPLPRVVDWVAADRVVMAPRPAVVAAARPLGARRPLGIALNTMTRAGKQ